MKSKNSKGKSTANSYKEGGKVKGFADGGRTNNALSAINSASTALNAVTPQDNTMAYGSNDYFKNKTKKQTQGDIANTAATGIAAAGADALMPGTGSTLASSVALAQAAGKALDPKDAYGVSQTGNKWSVGFSDFLNPNTSYKKYKDWRSEGDSQIEAGLKSMIGTRALYTNTENAKQRELLKQDYNDKLRSDFREEQNANIQDVIARRNAGLTGKDNVSSVAKFDESKLATPQAVDTSNVDNLNAVLNFDDKIKNGWANTKSNVNNFTKTNNFASKFFKDGGEVKGGTIKGKGTGTSDSIKAEVDSGSFIVPAKNNDKAKAIRRALLGDSPDVVAKVKGGDTDVKLSNGEHYFTPEEKAEIESYGIDLDDLAPDAEHGEDEMSKGGLTEAKAKIILKDGTIRGKALSDKQKGYFGLIAGGGRPSYNKGGMVKEFKDGGTTASPQIRKQAAEKYAYRDKLVKELSSPSAKKDPNYEHKVEQLNLANKTISDYERIYGNLNPSSKSTGAKSSSNKYTTPLAKPTEADVTFDPTKWAEQNAGPEDVTIVSQKRVPNLLANIPSTAKHVNSPTSLVDDAQVVASKTTDPINPSSKWMDYAGTALEYGIPLAQTAIGLSQIKKAGDRPIDKLDPDLVNAFNSTKRNVTDAQLAARYGLSQDELAALNMQNVGLTNSARYNARNIAGNNPSVALNLERAAANDAYGRTLQTKVMDKQLQRQKQQQAWALQDSVNGLAQYKQEANRRLFGDTMNAWQQKVGAAADLTSTGLTNLTDAAAANKRMNAFIKMNPNSYNV